MLCSRSSSDSRGDMDNRGSDSDLVGEAADGISREISTQASDSGGEGKEADNRGDPHSPVRHMEMSDWGNVEMKEKKG